MSGGGGGGYSLGGGGASGGGAGSGASISCDSLQIRTSLNSPNPDAVVDLIVGDLLDVIATTETGPVVVRDDQGRDVGSITSTQLLDLLACLAEGFVYSAKVTSIAGGNVKVEIRPEAA